MYPRRTRRNVKISPNLTPPAWLFRTPIKFPMNAISRRYGSARIARQLPLNLIALIIRGCNRLLIYVMKWSGDTVNRGERGEMNRLGLANERINRRNIILDSLLAWFVKFTNQKFDLLFGTIRYFNGFRLISDLFLDYSSVTDTRWVELKYPSGRTINHSMIQGSKDDAPLTSFIIQVTSIYDEEACTCRVKTSPWRKIHVTEQIILLLQKEEESFVSFLLVKLRNEVFMGQLCLVVLLSLWNFIPETFEECKRGILTILPSYLSFRTDFSRNLLRQWVVYGVREKSKEKGFFILEVNSISFPEHVIITPCRRILQRALIRNCSRAMVDSPWMQYPKVRGSVAFDEVQGLAVIPAGAAFTQVSMLDIEG